MKERVKTRFAFDATMIAVALTAVAAFLFAAANSPNGALSAAPGSHLNSPMPDTCSPQLSFFSISSSEPVAESASRPEEETGAGLEVSPVFAGEGFVPAAAASSDLPVAVLPSRPSLIGGRNARAYEHLITDAAARHGLSPLLVAAVTRVESDFDPDDLSNKGARGLMQVMPETGARFGVAADRLFDPAPNLAAGSAYLAWLLDRYRGDLDLALAAYNAGEGAVDGYRGVPPYRETRNYVRRVRSLLARMESGQR